MSISAARLQRRVLVQPLALDLAGLGWLHIQADLAGVNLEHLN